MILYVDETENDEYFIVAGLLLVSSNSAKAIYSKFKKSINNYQLSNKDKTLVYTEFKSTILDPHYQRIKYKLLNMIVSDDAIIIYSRYQKKTKHIKQGVKEKIYIRLLDNIVSSINSEIYVVFDRFNNKKFENKIISYFTSKSTVLFIEPADSQTTPGLQLVDNICSTIRMHISGIDKYDFYKLIYKNVRRV